jgi:hypothetical protein
MEEISSPFAPIKCHSIVCIPNLDKAFIFGGRTHQYSNKLLEFNPKTGVISKVDTTGDRPPSGFVFCVSFHPFFFFDFIDFSHLCVLPFCAREYAARYGASMVFFNNCLWVFGGYDDFSLVCDDFYCFDVAVSAWSKVSFNGKPLPRYRHSAAVIQDVL